MRDNAATSSAAARQAEIIMASWRDNCDERAERGGGGEKQGDELKVSDRQYAVASL